MKFQGTRHTVPSTDSAWSSLDNNWSSLDSIGGSPFHGQGVDADLLRVGAVMRVSARVPRGADIVEQFAYGAKSLTSTRYET